MKRKEEKADSALQENRLPLDIPIIEGSNQSYCYSSIMIYQLIRAYFAGKLPEFIEQVKKKREDFLTSRR